MADWHQYPTNFTNTISNTNGSSVGGVADFFAIYPTSIVDGFGLGLVCIMWLVFFSLSMVSGARKSVMVASFITGVLSVFLWRIGMIDPWVIFLMTALTIVGALGAKEENGSL